MAMFVAASGTAMAAGDAAAGKARAAACAGCHGPDGNSAAPNFPKLAGQHANYIVKQLKDFKQGKTRKDPVMQGQAAGLSEQDMANIAAFYAGQKTAPGAAAEDKVALGEKIYRGGNKTSGVPACSACHGPSGAGNPLANFPRLAGQHAQYVAKALRDFKSGARSNDAGRMMRDVAAKMTDTEIDAVASYIAGLH